MGVEIRPLERLEPEDLAWISGGYTSNERYRVTKTETPERTVITLDLQRLASPYVKRWDPTPPWLFEHYRSFLGQGFSFAAHDENRLAGLFLAERQDWNRTLWVWELDVKSEYRRQGVGRRLVEKASVCARRAGLRVIVCETQSTNGPAIRAYRALGFALEAVDLSYYTNDDADPDRPGAEVALFMKLRL